MAQIRDELILVDRFSTIFDRYVNKMGATAQMTRAAASEVEGEHNRMASSTESASVRMANSAATASQGVTDATQGLVNQLALAEENMNAAFTDTQRDAALSGLEKQMQRLGLVWTNAADETEGADRIMRIGLQELANQGKLTANVMAESAYRETAAKQQTAAAAAMAKQQGIDAATKLAEQSRMEQEAAEAAAESQRRHAESVERVKSALGGAVGFIAGHTAALWRSVTATSAASRAHGMLGRQLRRMAMFLFSIRRIFRFLTETMERVLDGIQKSWRTMINGVKDTFARGFASMLQTMQPAMDRFNEFMNSKSGQRFARGLETVMALAGQAVGFLLDKIAALGTWIGDNFNTVMAIAGTLLGLFAAKMMLTAISVAAANIPLLLLIGLVTAVVVELQAAGITSQEIFSSIGAGLGWLYALGYNLVADAWNLIATFAEFSANVFNDPVGAIVRLFVGLGDTVLGIVETAAGAIDALLGSNLSGAVTGWRDNLQKWADDNFGKNEIVIDRMEKLDYRSTMDTWAAKGGEIADTFSSFSLDSKLAPYLKSIDDNTGKTAQNTADLSDEDLKYMEDVAIRRYETHVNSTSLVPQVTVNVNGSADRSTADDIAGRITAILRREASSQTSITYAGV